MWKQLAQTTWSFLAATLLVAACGADPTTGEVAAPLTADAVAADPLDRDRQPALTTRRIALAGDRTFPEGIVAAPDGTLYVSGFGDGSIHKIDRDNRARVLRPAGADSRGAAVGMSFDERRGRLWVARFDFATARSALQAISPETGALIDELTPAGVSFPHFFNELARARDGRIFISDTLGPRVWVADPAARTVTVFAEDPLLANSRGKAFGLNGLALAPGGRWLVASVMDRIDQGDGRLVRINLSTGAVRDIALSGGAVPVFGGSDGMIFLDSRELLMVNVTPPAALVTARFNADYSSAALVQRPAFDATLNRPTAPAIRGGLLFVVNSQLDHIIDDENGALGTPPDLPFEIVGSPLRRLFGR